MILKRLVTSYLTGVAPRLSYRPSRPYNIYGHTTTTRMSLSSSSALPYPRAAVAVTVQSVPTVGDDTTSSYYHYLLIQRANEPNKGMWSIPGGKIELGETTLAAAKRELTEETCLPADDCDWYEHPFLTTDAIFYHANDHDNDNDNGDNDNSSSLAFHYVISQCFARVRGMPKLTPSDDALDAKWWTLEEIRECSEQNKMSKGVVGVVERVEELSQKNAL